jgi:hypothetical protein
MTPQLTLMQLWTLLAGGPIAMVLTVLVGILVNNAITKAHINRLEIKIDKVEGVVTSEMKRVEGVLTSELKRVEGVLGAKIDGLDARVKALEDEIRSPLVKR